ncbi:hypothetical protein ACKLNO_07880 [Neisseriaceae bacterium B1]
MTEENQMPQLPIDEDTKLMFQQILEMLDEFDEKHPHLIEQLFAGEAPDTDKN